MSSIEELSQKYLGLLKEKFAKTPMDWSPVEYLGSPYLEYLIEDGMTEITISKKNFLKKTPKLRVFVIPIKANTAEECLSIIESIKQKFEVELYSVIVFIGNKVGDGVITFVETFNHPSASLFLVEPGQRSVKKDYKSITKNYLQWIDTNSVCISTKERLQGLAQQEGKKRILTVERVREIYNYTHGQALDFLHSCKFLKRDGLTENYIFK